MLKQLNCELCWYYLCTNPRPGLILNSYAGWRAEGQEACKTSSRLCDFTKSAYFQYTKRAGLSHERDVDGCAFLECRVSSPVVRDRKRIF